MKTQIKTKELLKLINPLDEGINYKDTLISLDLDILKEYVTFPRKKEVFAKTDDIVESFYKNAALYIINANEPSFISINLDHANAVQSGLFEYVKAIYKKEDNVVISIPQEGDNLLFIKSKNLTEDKSVNLSMAKDIEYAALSSIFLQTKKVIKEELNIVEKDKFFWQEDGLDRFGSTQWVVEKIKVFLKEDKYKDSSVEKNVIDLLRKVNADVIVSDELAIGLLDLNDDFLNKLLLNKHPNLLKIDFSKDVFQDKLMQDVKSGNFSLLSLLLETGLRNKSLLDQVGFEKFLNEKESVDYLCKKNFFMSSSVYDRGNKFGLVSCYPFLNEENKRNKEIISKYLDSIKGERSYKEPYIADGLLHKMPIDIFNDERLLKSVLPLANIDEFYENLQKSGVVNPLLSDKNFLLNFASNLECYKIQKILNYFYEEKQVNKDMIMELITQKPSLFHHISNQESNTYYKAFSDMDVIMHASRNRVKNSDIKIEILLPHLITYGSKDEEDFKLEQVIARKLFASDSKDLYDAPIERAKYKQKYDKLEYCFFSVDEYSNSNGRAGKQLQKIKSPEAVKELLQNMENLGLSFEINYKEIYKNLHPDLKSDLNFLKETDILPSVRFVDLPETLQYNKSVAIEFIAKDIAHIPKEFFNDINFSLEFASCLDSGEIDIESAPDFITKFFTNQEVKSNYHEYLKTYISMSDLSQKLEVKEQAKSPRRVKI